MDDDSNDLTDLNFDLVDPFNITGKPMEVARSVYHTLAEAIYNARLGARWGHEALYILQTHVEDWDGERARFEALRASKLLGRIYLDQEVFRIVQVVRSDGAAQEIDDLGSQSWRLARLFDLTSGKSWRERHTRKH